MDTNTNKLLYLFEEIKSKITYLENALDEINQVKKSLRVTSVDVKAQIRDNISRHLEALRNREIWLLSQVELIVHGKEDVLTQKQSELLEVVSGMRKVCQLLDQSTGVEYLQAFEDQLSDLITTVEKLNVRAHESAALSFTGQNLDLLESIRTFGKVDPNKESEANIASLLNKMEISEGPGNKRKLGSDSTSVNSWLINAKKCPDYPVGSVEKWLTKCKPYSDADSEMGFSEMSDVDNKWLLSLQKNQHQPKDEVKIGYFEDIKTSSPSKWVRQTPKAIQTPNVFDQTYSMISSFGNESWLLYKQERKRSNSLPDDLGNIHANGDYSKWLRNSNSIASGIPETSTGKAYSSIAASGLKKWLKPKKSTIKCGGKRDCSDCDQWLLNSTNKAKNIDIESLADSDWLKIKDMEVMSIENLDSMFSFCSDDRANIKMEDKSGIEKYNSMLQAQPNEKWLTRSLSNQSTSSVGQGSDPMRMFEEYLASNDYNKWLVHPSGMSSDVCKWLARSSLERCKNCPESCSKDVFKLFDEVKSTSCSVWLKN